MKDNSLIITCAILGAEVTKDVYPHLLTTPTDLAVEAAKAVEAGASIIHLHVRDEHGAPSQSVDVFKEVTSQIKSRCDCIIQYSTGGAVGTSLNERCAPLILKPDMATLSMGTMNFGSAVFENDELTIKTIAKSIQEHGVVPELEIFDFGMIETAKSYLKKGFIPKKFHVDFVLGVPGGMSGSIKNLTMLVDEIPSEQTWTAAGIGRFELPLTAHAIAMGGHVRVGIEDNLYYRKGELAVSNAQLVQRVVRIAKELERPIASVATARKILGL
ncbi:MAG: 3-keto-5-aminohexanoate cleavage protein [Bacteriovoracaceae bacterium]|nr:3-keto-5-aminohexanoate cleavage protein [Bacteriovoracaceae bacterium]